MILSGEAKRQSGVASEGKRSLAAYSLAEVTPTLFLPCLSFITALLDDSYLEDTETDSNVTNMAAAQSTEASTGSSASFSSSSVSTGEQAEQAAANAPILKRRTTDPNLDIITFPSFCGLTLIVGTPYQRNGQVAFRVNKGSLRNASAVSTKLLTGAWAERDQSEVRLPDDDPRTMGHVLNIAH